MNRMDHKPNLKDSISDNNTKIHQFADKLIHFSSQYGRECGDAYTASNIAKGQLMIYPRYGDFKEAFVLVSYFCLI